MIEQELRHRRIETSMATVFILVAVLLIGIPIARMIYDTFTGITTAITIATKEVR